MFNRLRKALVGLTVFLAGISGTALSAHAQGSYPGSTGASSPSPRRIHLIGCASGSLTREVSGLGRIRYGGIGNSSLDRGLREDVAELCKIYQVNAIMLIMDEASSPNAFATDTVLPDVLQYFHLSPENHADGTVFLGTRLIQKEYEDGHGSGVSIPTVLGHEFAHILQNKRRFPLPSSKWQELHADYMAGWFTAHRSRYRPQDVNRSLGSIFTKGDYEFNNPGHHGTPRERANAFSAGYQLNIRYNESSALVAYTRGMDYLIRQGAPLVRR